MIKLTRLDGSEIFLNADLIEVIEETPDTHLTLSNGNRYLVLEPAKVVIDKIVRFKARILLKAGSDPSVKYLAKRRRNDYRPFCRL
ncbi:flagellar FlbD family protein [Geobacter sp. DSM 9736]|uniref:flagellar FlbD family protein n=1 Tax=Geobacter sp. DSM 9736 TaxID=1277350 RepID=UPI000B500F95|nr:flagellar FlbD family protein [Geobacter sp. DSM 9736]SNB47019.1 flagellar protein FlbD [Geobacter sp. DSM 9736]